MLEDDLRSKSAEMGGSRLLEWLEENCSNFFRVTDREQALVEDWERALGRLYRRHIHPAELPFRTHLPIYRLEAAAGSWGREMEVPAESWIESPPDLRLDEDLFVAKVVGHSMEPRIPAGSWCVFRRGEALAGSRTGMLVLVENRGADEHNRYTIKRYRSRKRRTDEGWEHEQIMLEPLNPEYEAWELTPEADIAVIGVFVAVLDPAYAPD
jgi:SOS-response transcriptional repressor LexA